MIKRINLSFNLTREKDKEVYDLIQGSGAKTKFVIDAILAYIDRNGGIDKEEVKEEVKEAVKEAIRELELDFKLDKDEIIKDNDNVKENQIPDDVFDMISGL